MPIEFLCSSCQQQLRVPDAAAGKNARCPKCSTILAVPGASQTATPPPPVAPTPGDLSFRPEPKPAPQNSAGGFDNPFGDTGPKPWSGPSDAANPYASPAGGFNEPTPLAGPIGHQVVDVGPILNHSFRVWQDNLGLLVGTTLVVAIISIVINGGLGGVLGVVMIGGEPILIAALGLVVQTTAFAITTFLGIGQAKICLKLARGQRADFADLFSGGSRFLPIFALMGMINGPNIFLQSVNSAFGGQRGSFEIQMVVNLLILLWSLAYIILGIIYWPCYYLVLEERAGVFESFGLAGRITEGNRLHSFLLFLLTIGILILGFLACLVGLLFAAPLTQLLLAVAYLMMSAQLSTNPGYQR